MEYLLALTKLLAPAYAIKFNVFGFPTNILMLWVILVWIIFLAMILKKHQLREFWKSVILIDKKLLVLIGLFFLSGIISLFAHGFDRQKLGQFIVILLQPLSIFFIGQYLVKNYPRTTLILQLSAYCLLAAAGLFAIIQYFTLWGLPQAFWGNSVEPKRALSFFEHPNFYALFAAPLLAFLTPNVFASLKTKFINVKTILWGLGVLGLLLSFSRAGWLGLGAAIFIYLIVAADKKIRRIFFSIFIVMVIVIVITPNLRYRFLLPFYGEKSTVSRLSLWRTGWKGIKESPITGLGLTGFSKNWERLNTDAGLAETHNFPHNIFLNFWVETGLLGLISILGIISIYIYKGLKSRQGVVLSVALFLICILFQGLIDNPYFKNDLAMVFWIILSVAI